MKNKKIKKILFLRLSLSALLFLSSFVLAASLYDYLNSGDTNGDDIGDTGTEYLAQSFTASADYDISSVKMRVLTRDGTPGNITVSIRATDVDGKPTGSDYASGTFSCNSIGAATWVETTFGATYSLTNGTKYAIVATGGNSTNRCTWRNRYDNAYANGGELYSSNGSSWTEIADRDLMFETWGDAAGTPPSTTIDYDKALSVILLAVFILLLLDLIRRTFIIKKDA